MAEQPQNDPFDAAAQQLGTVYAKALLDATDKAGSTTEVLDELNSVINDVMDRLPKLEAALVSPRISHTEKEGLLDRAFQGKMTPLLLNFLKVLSRHGRLDCLKAIRRAARELDNERRGRVEVEVETATPLSAEMEQAVKQKLSTVLDAEVLVKSHINEKLIGGIVVRVGDTVYDGSVAQQLQQVSRRALQRTNEAIRESLPRFAEVQAGD